MCYFVVYFDSFVARYSTVTYTRCCVSQGQTMGEHSPVTLGGCANFDLKTTNMVYLLTGTIIQDKKVTECLEKVQVP